MGIAQKEAGEVLYWLELMHKTDYINSIEFNSLQFDAHELLKIISKIIITGKQALLETNIVKIKRS